MGSIKMKTLILVASIIVFCESIKLSSLQQSYLKGVQAYNKERWSECIKQFEDALHLYKLYKSINSNCRLKCNAPRENQIVKENFEDLKIYEIFFERKDCLVKCLDTGFEDVKLTRDLDESVLLNLKQRKPYEYLHLCYFQMNSLPKAASAALTYLVLNPQDEVMANNVQYYKNQPEVNRNDVVDLESDDYINLYKNALKAYNENNWAETAANMEEALHDYFSSENICRVECEHQAEPDTSKEFSINLSNLVANLLLCQQHCQNKLKDLDYNSGKEFIADVLNYIQISYYKLGRYDEAAKAVATYLLLLPQDEDMLENYKIYNTIVDNSAFVERSDVTHYYKRDLYEKNLINEYHNGYIKIDD